MTRWMTRLGATFAFIAGLMLVSGGCSGSHAEECSELRTKSLECPGSKSGGADLCTAEQTLADQAGCDDEFADLISCYSSAATLCGSKTECVPGAFTPTCSGPCSNEEESFFLCVQTSCINAQDRETCHE